MLKCRKSIFLFAFLFMVISVGAMALSGASIDQEKARAAETQRLQLQKPTILSNFSETPLGQAQEAALQAKLAEEEALLQQRLLLEAELASMKQESNRGAEKETSFPSLSAAGDPIPQKEAPWQETNLGPSLQIHKEPYDGPANVVDWEMIARQGGDNVDDATAISSLPYSDAGTTVGYNDDYDETCPYSGSTSPDVVYSYVPSADITVDITLCVGSTYDTKLYVYENTVGNVIACNDDACPGWVSELLGVALTSGNTYYFVIDGYGGDAGDYTIDITEYAPCVVDCPAGGIPEGEGCIADDADDNFNGGCNSTPAVFSTINCDETVCGEVNTYLFGGSNYRDTDWYELTLAENSTLTWAAEGEFPILIFIIDAGSGDCADYSIVNSASGGPCEPISLTENLAAGTYWLWVGPNVYDGLACADGPWDYVASVTCEASAGPANDDCASATAVGEVSNLAFSTTQATFDGGGTCQSAPNIWYAYTASCDAPVTVSLCGSGYDTKLAVYDGISCSPLGAELGCNDDACGLQSEITFTASAGSSYLIEVGGFSSNTGDGVLSITCGTTCAVDCPAGGVPEGEACTPDEGIDNFNGGCNSSPAVFSTINCDEPVCGESNTYLFGGSNYRDTDWYELALGEPTTVTWTVEAEFDLLIFIIDAGSGDCVDYTILGTATAGPCEQISLTADIASAGNVWLWVGPSVYTGYPCSAGTFDYVGTATCVPYEPPPPPDNDDCAAALEVGDVTDLAFSTTDASFDGAGTCQYAPNLWYLYTASCDGLVTVSLCGSGYDTKVAAYDGASCSPLGTELACNDDACELQSEIAFPGVTGQQYLIEVGGYSSNTGDGVLSISCAVSGEGDDCTNAIKIDIPTLPYFDLNQTTCGRGNAYSSTCLGPYDGGEDIIYEITVLSAVDVDIMLDPKGTSWTGISISDVCPGSTCLDYSTSSSGVVHGIECIHLEPGVYYVMVDTWPSPDCIPDFDLTISECVPCAVDCPAGAIAEGEDCTPDEGVDNFNGGCNSTPPVFSPINCGETICGESNTFLFGGSNYRDTDWYEFTLDDWNVVTFEVEAEFDVLIFLIDAGSGDCTDYTLLSDATAGDCEVISLTETLGPGTYYAWVGPSVFTGYPCSAGPFDYVATLTCEPTVAVYCDASSGCSWEYICNVAVGEINNATNCDGYGDYTSLIANMAIGMGYDITVDNCTAWSSDICGVWVDWNQDVDFDDPDEFVQLSGGPDQFTGTISPPAGALNGMTRMRVRIVDPGANDLVPCGYATYGDIEDYSVNVGGTPSFLTVDPEAIDFGLVGPDATGSEILTLGVDGDMDLSFSIEVDYGGGKTGAPGTYTNLTTIPQESTDKPIYNGPENVPDESVVRQGGDDISTATVISALPYSDDGTTTGYNNDYDEVCPYSGSTAPDVVYSYTPSADITVDVTLCVGSTYDTKLYIYENTVGNLVACNDDECPGYVSELLEVALTGGNTYYIVVDGYSSANGYYTIDVTEFAAPEPFECPVGSVTEAEPCGDDNNGGCNMTTPTFEPVNCGDTVCGTVWADGGTRDTDWYELIMYQEGLVTWTASAEFPFVIGFVDTSDCNMAASLDPYALGNPGDVIEVSRVCGPGVYWLFVSHQDYYDYPCGGLNSYWATPTCDAGSVPILWLSTDPVSGTVPAAGTVPVTVSYDVAGLEQGVHTANLLITNSGGKSVTDVPVTIEVGSGITYLFEPDTVYVLSKFAVDPVPGAIYLSSSAVGGDVNNVTNVGLSLDACAVSLGTTEIITGGWGGLTGDVLKVPFALADYIVCEEARQPGGLVWDWIVSNFDISYELNTVPSLFNGEVAMRGHTSGDLNLDGMVDIADLIFMVEYMFNAGPAPRVMETADVDGSGGHPDIGDLVFMVEYMFNGGPPLIHQ